MVLSSAAGPVADVHTICIIANSACGVHVWMVSTIVNGCAIVEGGVAFMVICIGTWAVLIYYKNFVTSKHLCL